MKTNIVLDLNELDQCNPNKKLVSKCFIVWSQGYKSSMEKMPKCSQSEGQQRRPIKGTDSPSENQKYEWKTCQVTAQDGTAGQREQCTQKHRAERWQRACLGSAQQCRLPTAKVILVGLGVMGGQQGQSWEFKVLRRRLQNWESMWESTQNWTFVGSSLILWKETSMPR